MTDRIYLDWNATAPLRQEARGAMLAALEAKGRAPGPKGGGLTGDAPLAVDAPTSAAYGEALYRVFTAVARFRARLAGPQTPIVVWPEHFDLSTLWFPTGDRSDSAPQMNFGFAPFDSSYPRPYLYAYAYPMPEGFEQLIDKPAMADLLAYLLQAAAPGGPSP